MANQRKSVRTEPRPTANPGRIAIVAALFCHLFLRYQAVLLRTVQRLLVARELNRIDGPPTEGEEDQHTRQRAEQCTGHQAGPVG
jgi:hypothetical protein